MFRGIDSIQTKKELQNDLLASLCATQLPRHITCWKETDRNEETREWMSCKMCPNSDKTLISCEWMLCSLGKLALDINFLRNKLALVGSESDPARYSRERTLFGTWRCHILFETPFITSVSDAPSSTNLSPFMSSLYPVLTKYTPS